ncbi:MAG TPA: class I SAM-dependent methyltransferase [Mycobacteriales bacterium]|nr:class I SAM-dependent methyltransferase [Mycobacteriales bacterium]
MVGHPARVAQGGAQQVAALTPEQARLLLSPAGREAVSAAAALDLAPSARLRSAEQVRALAGPVLGPLALEQALLRDRARAKHPRGAQLWWTPDALEQATSAPVAAWRARRYRGPVLDLCCSVGGDLLALPDGSVGVDLDEARLLLARENAAALDRDVRLVNADATRLRLGGRHDVFVDPARRAGGRRVFDPRAYAPALDVVLGWRSAVRRLGVKVAPGVDHEALPDDVEVEVVSLAGEVKEAVLWCGAARSGVRRTATLLPGGDVLRERAVPTPVVRPPGRFLLEPDGAVVRAHLVAQVADDVGGWLLDATIAYVAADRPVPTPFGRWYAVHESFPFSLKALRARLRGLDVGTVVVKKRGTAVEPEQLRRRLGLTGSRAATVVLTRCAGRQSVLLVEPLAAAG